MIKRIFTTTTVTIMLLTLSVVAHAALTSVPEQFQGFKADSTYSIKYDDVNELLKKTVVNTGRSTRERAEPNRAATGTRLKRTVKRATANEANRFYFEVFQGDDEAKAVLMQVKSNLEMIPGQVELAAFSRNEQLAYWLNLHNITLLNALVEIYPQNKLKRDLTGKKSILDQKLVKVAGVDLSLNDIKFILRKNYDSNPLVIYGLYQGIIGGPNIRKVAYTGSNVYAALQDNAEEFVNSNRGTYAKDEKTFRVSSLYERDADFFASDDMLKKHLLTLLQSPELEELKAASNIKTDIDDWTITDLFGSSRDPGAALATNSAALIDSMQSTQPGGEGQPATISTNFSSASSSAISKSVRENRFSPDLLIRMQEVNARREMQAMGSGTVTVEELGAVEVEPTEPNEIDNN